MEQIYNWGYWKDSDYRAVKLPPDLAKGIMSMVNEEEFKETFGATMDEGLVIPVGENGWRLEFVLKLERS